MDLKDLLIWNNSGSGDIFISSDVSLGETLCNLAYICMFGGNVEESTKGNEKKNEIRKDWWANSLIFKYFPIQQFNSETEKTLRNVALNSQGRVKILQSIKNDLKPLKNYADFDAEVYILSSFKVNINIYIKKGNNKENLMSILWDNLSKTNVINKIV